MAGIAVITPDGIKHELVVIATFKDKNEFADNYDVGWQCSCGTRGISTDKDWARHDHARHIRNSGR